MPPEHIVKQRKERGIYDRHAAYAVIDAGMICHVGFVQDDRPVVIPMLYARDGDHLLLHGAVASRLMQRLSTGLPVCVGITHLDGLVLAASVFHHSANYRSMVLFGNARLIEDPVEKANALERMVEFMLPGRNQDARSADAREMNATTVLSVPIETFSVKSRSGGPGEAEAKDPRDIWTGVIPIFHTAGSPQVCQNPGRTPNYIRDFQLPAHRTENDSDQPEIE